MGRFPFLVFIICSTLICVPLAYYYGIASMYLGNAGFLAPASAMTVGQMSEIFFMLLIPFFFRRLGVKTMILVGMLAWVARYALFALGADDQIAWMLFFAIALHGICYDFFFVTGFMYTDKVASKDVRGQAQGMLVFFTQGVGMYFGYMVAFAEQAKTVTKYGDLTAAIEKTRTGTLSFTDALKNMFSVALASTALAFQSRLFKVLRAIANVRAAAHRVVSDGLTTKLLRDRCAYKIQADDTRNGELPRHYREQR